MKKTLHLLMALFTFAFASAQTINDGTYSYEVLAGTTDCELIGWVTLPTAAIDVVIPSEVVDNGTTYNVVQIASGAFSAHGSKGTYRNAANTNITSITLPSSITTVGDHAARNLPNLATVNLENVVTLGTAAFNGSTGLTGEINLTNCTTLGNYAFFSCHNITKLNTPALITVGVGNFYAMFGLTEFEVPATVTSVQNLFGGIAAVADIDSFVLTQFKLNWDATELATLTTNSSNLPTNFFRNITDKSGITMYIPEDAPGETVILDAYTAHPQFGQFTNIVQGDLPVIDEGLSAEDIEAGTLDIQVSSDIITVNSTSTFTNANLTIYDVTGRVLVSKVSNSTSASVNVSNLPSGVYIVKVTEGNAKLVKRFAKQ